MKFTQNCCSTNPIAQELGAFNQQQIVLKWLKGELQELAAIGGCGGNSKCKRTQRVQASSWTMTEMDCRKWPGLLALPKQHLRLIYQRQSTRLDGLLTQTMRTFLMFLFGLSSCLSLNSNFGKKLLSFLIRGMIQFCQEASLCQSRLCILN